MFRRKISPGDDFSQALLFLAGRFLLAGPIGSILRYILRRCAFRLGCLGSLTGSGWRLIRLGRRVGAPRCSRSTGGILRRGWPLSLRPPPLPPSPSPLPPVPPPPPPHLPPY